MKPLICVDFDGTITDDVQTVLPGCIEALTKFQETYTVCIFSARATVAERNQMTEFLTKHNVPYDEVLPPKPDAVAFIDDKGIHFTSWDKAADEVTNRHPD